MSNFILYVIINSVPISLNPESATGCAGTYLLISFAVLTLKLCLLLLRVELLPVWLFGFKRIFSFLLSAVDCFL